LACNACAVDFQGDTLQCWIITDHVIHATNIFGAVAATKDKCKDYDKKNWRIGISFAPVL
jgi:hypothetical protein